MGISRKNFNNKRRNVLWLIILVLVIGFFYYEVIYSTNLQECLSLKAEEIDRVSIIIPENSINNKISIDRKSEILKLVNELSRYSLRRKYIKEKLFDLGHKVTFTSKGLSVYPIHFLFSEKDRCINIEILYSRHLRITVTDLKSHKSKYYIFEIKDEIFNIKSILE